MQSWSCEARSFCCLHSASICWRYVCAKLSPLSFAAISCPLSSLSWPSTICFMF